MTNEHSIAFKYAKALFMAAAECGDLDEVARDCTGILSILDKTPELDAFLKNPAALEKETAKALQLIFHGIVGKATLRFLKLLAKNKRISLLELILKRFAQFREEASQIIRVRLEYGGNLTNKSKRVMVDALRKSKTVSEVRMEYVERPFLIGGVRLIFEGRLYDNSIRASFNRLRSQLLYGGDLNVL